MVRKLTIKNKKVTEVTMLIKFFGRVLLQIVLFVVSYILLNVFLEPFRRKKTSVKILNIIILLITTIIATYSLGEKWYVYSMLWGLSGISYLFRKRIYRRLKRQELSKSIQDIAKRREIEGTLVNSIHVGSPNGPGGYFEEIKPEDLDGSMHTLAHYMNQQRIKEERKESDNEDNNNS